MARQDWVKVWPQLPPVGQPIELLVKMGPGREAALLARRVSADSPCRFASLATGEALPGHWQAEYWRPAPLELLRLPRRELTARLERLKASA